MKTRKIVKVEWDDTASHRGWHDINKAKDFDPLPCVSCGILVKVKKGNIGIAQSLAECEDIGETLVISRKSIQKITVLDTFRM